MRVLVADCKCLSASPPKQTIAHAVRQVRLKNRRTALAMFGPLLFEDARDFLIRIYK